MAELLSPAGDWDCLRAAVENGADAVYFGLDVGWNARARATNFPLTDLPEILRYLHTRGVKGYVTLNTLVFPDELEQTERLVRPMVEQGVDAVLVQDLGMARLMHTMAPGLALHASTQMTLTSAPCMALAHELGITRVVLPRELSLREIAKVARETSLELEAFVHGALCVAYSGQCLTSESLGGRSANRGQCAQACRLPYQLVCDGQEVDLGDQQYLLSPQDLAGYDLVPELLKAGVTCLKIEGRLKTPEYVANITRHYRRALDAALSGGRAEFGAEQVRDMEMSFSRGFSPGWLQGCDHKMLVPAVSSAKRGARLGTVVQVVGQRVRVALTSSVRRGDGVGFDVSRSDRQQQGSRVYEIVYQQQSRPDASAGMTVDLGFARGAIDPKWIFAGQAVWTTSDPVLDKQLRKSFTAKEPLQRVPLDCHVTAIVGKPLIVHGKTATGIELELESEQPLVAANQHPITESLVRSQLGRLGNTIYTLRDVVLRQQGAPLVPLSVFGKIRRQLVDELAKAQPPQAKPVEWNSHAWAETRAWAEGLPSRRPAPIESPPPSPTLVALCRTLQQLQAIAERYPGMGLYADFQDIREFRQAVQIGRASQSDVFLVTPRIQKPDELGIFHAMLRHQPQGVVVRNLAGLSFFARHGLPLVADFSLNAANEFTVALLRSWGADWVTPSYDLNRDQLYSLVDHSAPEFLEMVIHQHMPMFHMEHCVFCAVLSPGTNKTNCGRPCDRHHVELRDRVGMLHPLKADVGCRNTLFNAQAQSGAEAVSHLCSQGVLRYRVELLDESCEDARHVVAIYRQLLCGDISGSDVCRQLNAFNRVGVTRGTLETARDPLALL